MRTFVLQVLCTQFAAAYLDEVLGIGGEDGAEHEVVQVGVLRGMVVVKVDEVLNVVVRPDISHQLHEKK